MTYLGIGVTVLSALSMIGNIIILIAAEKKFEWSDMNATLGFVLL